MKPCLMILALISMIGMSACSLIKYSNKTKGIPVYIHDTSVKYLAPQIDTFTVNKHDTTWTEDTILVAGKEVIQRVNPKDIHDTTIRYLWDQSAIDQAEDSATMWKGMYAEDQIDKSSLKHTNSDLIWALVCSALFFILIIVCMFYYKNKTNAEGNSTKS